MNVHDVYDVNMMFLLYNSPFKAVTFVKTKKELEWK